MHGVLQVLHAGYATEGFIGRMVGSAMIWAG